MILEGAPYSKILGKSPVLMVIDVQHDFVDPDGAVSSPATSVSGTHEVILNIRQLVLAAKAAKIPTIFTREVHRPSLEDMGRELDGSESPHCIEGTHGSEIVEELGTNNLSENQFIMNKRRYSAFLGTELVQLLHAFHIDTLILTGATTNVCVHYTGADAHQYDYRIRVVEDATAGTTPEAHKAALQALAYLQKDAIVHIPEVLEEMERFRKSQ